MKCNEQWFSVLSAVFEHEKVVPSTEKIFGAREVVEYATVFANTRNSRTVPKSSAEYIEPLLIVLKKISRPNYKGH